MIAFYENINDKYLELNDSMLSELLKISDKGFQNFIKVNFASIVSTNYIKNSIFEICESENIYSIKILFRSLVEHYLRFQYLYLRYIEEKSDNVYEKFIQFSKISDGYLYGQSIKSVNDILNKADINFDSFEVIKGFFPDLENLSKKEFNKELEEFNIKKIIRYINNSLSKLSDLENNYFIVKLILIYSELSSYVHGNYTTIEDLAKLNTDEKRMQEMEEYLKFSTLISISISSLTCIPLIKENEAFKDFFMKFNSIFKQVH